MPSWIRVLAVVLAAVLSPPVIAAPPVLIAGARIFDGTGAKASVRDVLLRGDRIVAVGRSLAIPANALRVDGAGRTLIPGLHDLHTHLRAPGYAGPEDMPKAWAGHLLAGVTSVTDFSVSGEMIAPIRAMAASGRYWAPHLSLAVRLGVPGGHGTEYGWGPSFTLEAITPREGARQAALALSYDPDVLKVFADGWRYDRDPDLASMNRQTLAAINAAASAMGRPVVTHTVTHAGAALAAGAEVAALGHGIGDLPANRALTAGMRAGGTAYIATMAAFEPQQTRRLSAGEAALLSRAERTREARAAKGPVAAYDTRRWRMLRDNLSRMRRAGVRVGIGTDAGIGGVYHGSSALREIAILTENGFSAREALSAATRDSAAIMGRAGEHGTIAPGMRADLVLVGGRPDRDIADLARVERVWLAGREVPLAELRRLRDDPATTPMPSDPMPGPILTGMRGDGRTDLDTLPVVATDAGVDNSILVPTAGPGARPTALLTAQFGAAQDPYAAWVLPLTRGGVHVADAGRFAGIEITARGANAYRLVLESHGLTSRDWFGADLVLPADGGAVRIPFSAFVSRDADARLDTARLRAVRIVLLGETGGTGMLEIASLRFYEAGEAGQPRADGRDSARPAAAPVRTPSATAGTPPTRTWRMPIAVSSGRS